MLRAKHILGWISQPARSRDHAVRNAFDKRDRFATGSEPMLRQASLRWRTVGKAGMVERE